MTTPATYGVCSAACDVVDRVDTCHGREKDEDARDAGTYVDEERSDDEPLKDAYVLVGAMYVDVTFARTDVTGKRSVGVL